MLDTNICIELTRYKNAKILKRLTSLRVGDVALSSITVAELQHGAEKSKSTEQSLRTLEEFLAPFAIIDFDYDSAATYGKIRADLERRGALIGPMDMLIAAQAVTLGLTLVTHNVKEFKRVKGLEIEDWL